MHSLFSSSNALQHLFDRSHLSTCNGPEWRELLTQFLIVDSVIQVFNVKINTLKPKTDSHDTLWTVRAFLTLMDWNLRWIPFIWLIKGLVSTDLITTDPLLFQQLKLPLQLRLPLHLLLSPAHKHSLAVEFGAIHVLYSLWKKSLSSEGMTNKDSLDTFPWGQSTLLASSCFS